MPEVSDSRPVRSMVDFLDVFSVPHLRQNQIFVNIGNTMVWHVETLSGCKLTLLTILVITLSN
jgi:hypothetical protein